MSNRLYSTHPEPDYRPSGSSFLCGLIFWGFVVIKIWGHIFAAWSWWWFLFPIVPWIGAAVAHFGL